MVVLHKDHFSTDDRFKFFLVEGFDEETSVVSEYLGFKQIDVGYRERVAFI